MSESGAEFYKGRPLVFGHRGARQAAPENTLAAFRKAHEMGADGIELDVMLSADGVPVVIHDSTVDRTTNGSGRVRELTLDQLRELDAGGRFASQFSGEPIPTLAEVLDAFGSALRINIELKSASTGDDGLEARVVELLRARSLGRSIVFSSFNPLSLWRAKRLAPEIRRGLLYAPDMPVYLSRAWAAPFLGLDAVHPEGRMVDAGYVRWAHGKGYHVNVWTVNEPPEMLRLIELGVDVLITDRPDVARTLVDAQRR